MTIASTTPPSMCQPQDVEFFARELEDFLPDRIFDAHCHLWNVPGAFLGLDAVGYDEYTALIRDVHGDRTAGALFIPFWKDLGDAGIASANTWTAQATGVNPNYRGIYFIRPTDDPEAVREDVRRLGLHGLKCYHTAANVNPTWEAQIPDYLPESFVKVAHEEGWVITLHMVRSRGCADPGNIKWIRHYCENYPNMTLILAHSARGFQPTHNLEGLPHLKGLDNLYVDSSANCDPIAHQSVIRILGHDKLMHGTDLPVSHMRGRSVPVADTFLWLYEQTPVWVEKHLTINPVLTGLEHLRSMKWACWSERLTDTQVEDIFWNNAARLFGVD